MKQPFIASRKFCGSHPSQNPGFSVNNGYVNKLHAGTRLQMMMSRFACKDECFAERGETQKGRGKCPGLLRVAAVVVRR
jgi:hypothetical protein